MKIFHLVNINMPPRVSRKPRVRRARRIRRVRPRRIPRAMGVPRSHRFTRIADCNNSNFVVSSSSVNGESFNKTADGFYLNTGAGGVSNITYFTYALCGTLDALPDYTEFTALFDQYKILRMTLTLRAFQTTSLNNSSGGQQCLSVIHYGIVDYDDAVVFTPNNPGVQLMRERSTFRERNFFSLKPYKRTIRPRIAMSAYGAGAFSSYANMKSQWIDSNSPSVQMYGFKGMFEVFAPSSSASSYIWFRPELTYHLACREVR